MIIVKWQESNSAAAPRGPSDGSSTRQVTPEAMLSLEKHRRDG